MNRSFFLSVLSLLWVLPGVSMATGPFGTLENLVIDPKALPKACDLIWTTPPHPLRPSDDSKVLLETIWGFWFPGDASRLYTEVEVGFSNMYVSPYGQTSPDPLVMPETPITVLGFLLESETQSMEAEAAFRARFRVAVCGGDIRFRRKGRNILWLARGEGKAGGAGTSKRCAEALWTALEEKL